MTRFMQMLVAACVAAIVGVSAGSQDAPKPDAKATDAADAEFAKMLQAAKVDPEKTDFPKLRAAFTKTSRYEPYEIGRIELRPIMSEVEKGNTAAALETLDKSLTDRWVDPESQWAAAMVCNKLGETDREKLHQAFAKGLTDAILKHGDGRSFDTAWPVISIGEEYFVLRALELSGGEQALATHEGHWFDIHTFKSEKDGEKRSVYFNIDLPKEKLSETVKALIDAAEKRGDLKKDDADKPNTRDQ